MHPWRIRNLILAVLLCTASLALKAQTVRYVYDAAGRLVAVIDQNGDAAVYHYDAVGNVLSITRQSAGTVSIIEFAPRAGAVGTTVTIYGTGFSATPSQNAVTFNGTSATVSASTTTTITTTVPSGATTGALAVTTPGGSASSGVNFQVISTPAAPSITSFTPTIALAGTAISITGTGFETVTANNRLSVNVTRAATFASTSTSLTMPVPLRAGSGRVTVSTLDGTGVSSADLFLPPSPYAVSDVQFTGRASFSSATAVAIPTATRIGLVVVDAVAGHRVSVKVVPGPISVVWLYRPDGVAVGSVTAGALPVLLEPQVVTTSGTYTVMVDPSLTYTGTTTITPYDVPADITGSIVAGGSAVTAALNTPGQNAALTFSGTSTHRMSVAISSGPIGTVSLKGPTGTTLASTSSGALSAFIEPTTLPTTGTHTVSADPTGANTGSLTHLLYDVPADTTGTVTIGGSATSVSLGTPGQNGTLTFTGAASQQVTVRVTSNTMGTVTVKLLKSDGTVLTSTASVLGSFNLATITLPSAGTYTILVDPTKAGTGSMNVAVTSP